MKIEGSVKRTAGVSEKPYRHEEMPARRPCRSPAIGLSLSGSMLRGWGRERARGERLSGGKKFVGHPVGLLYNEFPDQ